MEQSPLQPAPLGAIRFNTDSSKLEYYDGNQWVNITSDSPQVQTGGTRGLFAGGLTPSLVDTIEYINVDSTGNAVDFGNLASTSRGIKGLASRTRGVWCGGYEPGYPDRIQFVTIASTGDTTDFGNLTIGAYLPTTFSNETRGIIAAMESSPLTNNNVIDYITIASAGDAKDFGDLTEAQQTDGSFSSPTRGFWVGGAAGSGPTYQASTTGTKIECVTTTTLGDAFDFGDLQNGTFGKVGASNSTRGLAAGGYRSPANILAIELITMATLGNSTNFGDTTNSHYYGGGASDPIRALFAGGSGPTDIIEYVNITTEGDAVDFGNLSQARNIVRGLSNANGGL